MCSIGIDVHSGGLTLAQLGKRGTEVILAAAHRLARPQEVAFGSPDWQRWAVQILRRIGGRGAYRGRSITTALPANEIVVDCIKSPPQDSRNIEDVIFSKISRKLPPRCARKDTLIKCIPTEGQKSLVMAAERTAIDRYLAVYERAGLAIKSIATWPTALAECYATLFAPRPSDRDAAVMLVAFRADRTNVAISRHRNLLYASSYPVDRQGVQAEEYLGRVTAVLTNCRREFLYLYPGTPIERLIFFSESQGDRHLCQELAAQMEVHAQLADCLGAVKAEGRHRDLTTQEGGEVNWAFSFGLSLC